MLSFHYEVEVSFSSGNANATITNVRHRIVLTYANDSACLYLGLPSVPNDSNPFKDKWINTGSMATAGNTIKALVTQKSGDIVTIRDTQTRITFPD